MVLSFFGNKHAVDKLFHGPLASMLEIHRQFWLATADMASGNVDSARDTLRELRTKCDPVTQSAIDRRLSRLLTPAASLGAEAQQVLHQLEQDMLEEERFGENHVSRAHGRVTLGLLAFNLLGFAAEVTQGDSTDVTTLYELGALYVPAVLSGEWWRVFLAQFLHFGGTHLLINMVGLISLGRYLEFALGKIRYLGVYMASGTGAMLVVVLTHMNGESQRQMVVGPSGGVMGLIGATAAIMLTGWRVDGAQLAKRRLVSLSLILALQVLFDFSMPQVSSTAHISGAIIGLLVTLLLKSRFGSERKLQPNAA